MNNWKTLIIILFATVLPASAFAQIHPAPVPPHVMQNDVPQANQAQEREMLQQAERQVLRHLRQVEERIEDLQQHSNLVTTAHIFESDTALFEDWVSGSRQNSAENRASAPAQPAGRAPMQNIGPVEGVLTPPGEDNSAVGLTFAGVVNSIATVNLSDGWIDERTDDDLDTHDPSVSPDSWTGGYMPEGEAEGPTIQTTPDLIGMAVAEDDPLLFWLNEEEERDSEEGLGLRQQLQRLEQERQETLRWLEEIRQRLGEP